MLFCFLLHTDVNQRYVCIYPSAPPLPSCWLPSRPSQSAELSSLGCQQAPSSCPFYTWQCIHVSSALSLGPTLSFLPGVGKSFSLCLHLYFCAANNFISTIFLDSIYLLKPAIWFSLSLLGTMAQPVYRATQEAEAEGSLEPRSSGLQV